MSAPPIDAIGPGAWEVRSRALVLEVLRDDVTFTVDDPRFSTAMVVGPSMLSTDGAEHARHRAPFARAYRLDAVRRDHTEAVRDECDALIDRFADAGEAELRRQLAGPLAVATMARALGLDALPVTTVLGWYEAIVAAVTEVTDGGVVTPEGHAAFAAMADHLRPALPAAGDLTPDEAVSNAAVLLFGGRRDDRGDDLQRHPACAGAPAAAGVAGGRPVVAPERRERVAAARSGGAVRRPVRDRRCGGGRRRSAARRPGARLAAACQPRSGGVRRPGAVRPAAGPTCGCSWRSRRGPHVCLGMHLARLETATALDRLLDRLPGVELDPARPAVIGGAVFHKPPELWVRW